jgi:CheY-like chemotaxis protein
VAHEINNPLAFVLTNLNYLEAEVGSDRADLRASLAEAADGVLRVRRIVADLKLFARAHDEGRRAVDPQEAVRSALDIAGNEIRHRARLILEWGPVPSVDGDAGRLGQVFLNLLINAAQALGEPRPEGHEIRVRTSTDADGRAAVEISDTGVGMTREILDRLFDPFFTTKPVGVGTGLGLSICHGILAAHGGEVCVESEPGRGSRFTVLLPPGNLVPARPRPEPEPSGATRQRVLIVDDEPLILSAIVRGLARRHDVVAAAGGEEALARIRAGERFDAILCDVMMPGMSGIAVFAQLSELAPDQARRVAFITGGVFDAEASTFLEAQANPVVQKPFPVKVALAVIDQLALRAVA